MNPPIKKIKRKEKTRNFMKNKKIHSNFRESDKYILNTKPGGFLPPNFMSVCAI